MKADSLSLSYQGSLNYIQYPMIHHNRKEYIFKKDVYLFAVQQKLNKFVNKLCFNFKKGENKEKKENQGEAVHGRGESLILTQMHSGALVKNEN